MIGLKVKPLSVNEAWQGRRFKTRKYKSFEKKLLMMLPDISIPEGNLVFNLDIGFSNKDCDLSNPLKLVEDILQKKYGFNDNRIYEIHMRKEICEKGAEYIMFSLESQNG